MSTFHVNMYAFFGHYTSEIDQWEGEVVCEHTGRTPKFLGVSMLTAYINCMGVSFTMKFLLEKE